MNRTGPGDWGTAAPPAAAPAAAMMAIEQNAFSEKMHVIESVGNFPEAAVMASTATVTAGTFNFRAPTFCDFTVEDDTPMDEAFFGACAAARACTAAPRRA